MKVKCKHGTIQHPAFLLVALTFGVTEAALSISSGYETFLKSIRQRIVCAEDDVFDEAIQRSTAPPCDSMRDGPFCRALPASDLSSARHKPFTLDSIVPQHIFGDPRASQEFSTLQAIPDTELLVNRQATHVLNQFLEDFNKGKEVPSKVLPTEGRIDFSKLPLGGDLSMPLSFSYGLPAGVVATWEGPWQVTQASAANIEVHAETELRTIGPNVAARLNGVLGTIRFSRPVVLRKLLVRPPFHASDGAHKLWVRGRKAGKEVWRSEYDINNATLGLEQPKLPCAVGDPVNAKWAHDGKRYMATILVPHGDSATVHWHDNDHSHRHVSYLDMTGSNGKSCSPTLQVSGVDRSRGKSLGWWRDLARRTLSVDEVSFLVPSGVEGWLLSELVVSAIQWQPEADAGTSDDALESPPDHTYRVVQVLPGPHAIIQDVSTAAVFYNADDMLERGFRLDGWSLNKRPLRAPIKPAPSSPLEVPTPTGVDPEQELLIIERKTALAKQEQGSDSGHMKLTTFRSMEGLKQLIRALAEDPSQQPLHQLAFVSRVRVISDLTNFIDLLNISAADQKVVKRYAHFEALFADFWDWRVPVDSLHLLYEKWKFDPIIQKEAQYVFARGQNWQGFYYCTQGRTRLSLNIRERSFAGGSEAILADLTFTIESTNNTIVGKYRVFGRYEPIGRTLVLDPVPNSWKDPEKFKSFVMVGLQGVVSKAGSSASIFRYAGSIPILGCDAFELYHSPTWDGATSIDSRLEVDGSDSIIEPGDETGGLLDVELPTAESFIGESAIKQSSPWNGALQRLVQALDETRRRWRQELQFLMRNKDTSASKPKVTTAMIATTPEQVAQLLEAARAGSTVSFEITSTGQDVVVRVG